MAVQPCIKHSILRTTENKYTPIALAGSRRHGDVWLCTSTSTPSSSGPAELVAIKSPKRASRDELAHEAGILRQIQNHLTGPNTEEMQKHFPLVIDSTVNYLALTFIPGLSLRQLIETAKSLPHKPAVPKSLVLHIASQLADAVGFLHNDVKVCHRDLWEGNVMLWLHGKSGPMPDVVLIDFGSAVKGARDQSLAWERSYVYGMVERLGAVNRRVSGGRSTDGSRKNERDGHPAKTERD